MKRTIDKLTRFQIESILAYEYVGRSAEAAAELMRIGRSSIYQDFYVVSERTGLNPLNELDLVELLKAIHDERKGKMGDRVFKAGDYLQGKCPVAERTAKRP